MNLQVTPKGDSADGIRGKYLSLFLQLTDCERFPSNTTVNASFKLKILDQLHNQHYEKTGTTILWTFFRHTDLRVI